MLQDKMTPLERMTAYNKGEAIDRLPCNPNIANGASRVIGCKISEFKGNGKLIAKAQNEAYRKFGYDGGIKVKVRAKKSNVVAPSQPQAGTSHGNSGANSRQSRPGCCRNQD